MRDVILAVIVACLVWSGLLFASNRPMTTDDRIRLLESQVVALDRRVLSLEIEAAHRGRP